MQRNEHLYERAGAADGDDVLVLKKLGPKLPERIVIDVYGWGPFKDLVLRRG